MQSEKEAVNIFRIYLSSGGWCRIAVSGHHTLNDLNAAIISALKLNEKDSMRYFFRKGRKTVSRTVSASCRKKKSFGNLCLSSLHLMPGDGFHCEIDGYAHDEIDIYLERSSLSMMVLLLPLVVESFPSGIMDVCNNSMAQ